MRVYTRTQISETAQTHKYVARRHIVVDHKITTIRQTINFLGTKTTPIQAEDLFFSFGLHLISDTKAALILGEFSEKVRTRQNFCAQRPQKIRGNIGVVACKKKVF